MSSQPALSSSHSVLRGHWWRALEGGEGAGRNPIVPSPIAALLYVRIYLSFRNAVRNSYGHSNRTGQDRTGQDRTEQNRTERNSHKNIARKSYGHSNRTQVRTEQNRIELNRTEQNRTEQNKGVRGKVIRTVIRTEGNWFNE